MLLTRSGKTIGASLLKYVECGGRSSGGPKYQYSLRDWIVSQKDGSIFHQPTNQFAMQGVDSTWVDSQLCFQGAFGLYHSEVYHN